MRGSENLHLRALLQYFEGEMRRRRQKKRRKTFFRTYRYQNLHLELNHVQHTWYALRLSLLSFQYLHRRKYLKPVRRKQRKRMIRNNYQIMFIHSNVVSFMNWYREEIVHKTSHKWMEKKVKKKHVWVEKKRMRNLTKLSFVEFQSFFFETFKKL